MGTSPATLSTYQFLAPTAPSLVGGVTLNSSVSRVLKVYGRKAYIAGDSGGMELLELATSDKIPVSKSVFIPRTSSRTMGVSVNGGYAYVTDFDYGMHIVDIRVPTAPVLVDTVHLSGGLQMGGILACNDVAYAAECQVGNINILDVSRFDAANPAIPPLYVQYPISPICTGTFAGIVAEGQYLYIAEYYGSFKILHLEP
jgi:hypothetical protein